MKTKFTNFRNWILAGCLMVVGSMAEATIIYHDEDPDVTKNQPTDGTQEFDIDVNNDAAIDFTIYISKGDTSYNGTDGNGAAVAIECKNGSAVAQSTGTPVSLAAAYDAGNTINSGLSWQTTASVMRFKGYVVFLPPTQTPVTVGNFSGSTDKYLGVRFTVATNTYYGWVRVAVSDDGESYTVKDWAYEDTPDTDIDAGELAPTAVNKQLLATTTIVNKNNSIEVTFANPLSGTINAINMSGSMVCSVSFNGSSCVVNMQYKPSGIYNLIFETTGGEFAKKIYVE